MFTGIHYVPQVSLVLALVAMVSRVRGAKLPVDQPQGYVITVPDVPFSAEEVGVSSAPVQTYQRPVSVPAPAPTQAYQRPAPAQAYQKKPASAPVPAPIQTYQRPVPAQTYQQPASASAPAQTYQEPSSDYEVSFCLNPTTRILKTWVKKL